MTKGLEATWKNIKGIGRHLGNQEPGDPNHELDENSPFHSSPSISKPRGANANQSLNSPKLQRQIFSPADHVADPGPNPTSPQFYTNSCQSAATHWPGKPLFRKESSCVPSGALAGTPHLSGSQLNPMALTVPKHGQGEGTGRSRSSAVSGSAASTATVPLSGPYGFGTLSAAISPVLPSLPPSLAQIGNFTAPQQGDPFAQHRAGKAAAEKIRSPYGKTECFQVHTSFPPFLKENSQPPREPSRVDAAAEEAIASDTPMHLNKDITGKGYPYADHFPGPGFGLFKNTEEDPTFVHPLAKPLFDADDPVGVDDYDYAYHTGLFGSPAHFSRGSLLTSQHKASLSNADRPTETGTTPMEIDITDDSSTSSSEQELPLAESVAVQESLFRLQWPSQVKRNGSVVGRIRSHLKPYGTASGCVQPTPGTPAFARGVGYGGTGWDMAPFHHHGKPVHSQSRLSRSAGGSAAPKKAADEGDGLLESYFRLVTVLLPSQKQTGIFHAAPPDFLASILSRSPLMSRAAEMLGTNSIEETSRHASLYDAIVDFINALGNHAATVGLVYEDRPIYAEGGRLFQVSFGSGRDKEMVASKVAVKDTGTALVTLLGALAEQAKSVLQHSKKNPKDFSDENGQNLLTLSKKLCGSADLHNKNKQRFRNEMDISGGGDAADVNLTEWHRENCVQDAPDEMLLVNFSFAALVGTTAKKQPPVGRMRRLITEISNLRASLPEGIFVRHGSSRLDMMKVLIVGPRGTPYEYGFFEFDLFCTMDYPNVPPMMRFITTNRGRTRFNPNLYEDGKICLSLLGTWSGEQWNREKSRILQLLVSIQSMILCEQPWYNEPGRERFPNTAMSNQYNDEVRSWTLQHAILPWATAVGAQGDGEATTVAGRTRSAAATAPRVAPHWRKTAQLYLRVHARDIIDAAQSALDRQSGLDSTLALMQAVLEAKRVLRNQGYLP
ncbi:hypothetical protein DL766_006027 [Monosporascus sp. MC13-8B]|uniref:UBC core domain-containing protein n=1 Tax=Monosporascus cannonballus TaxID=155416 RepID=A0ABY0GTR0_9PEZI|nr:hypothetical protein DL762_009617 [Monosporascus cannonballus]RYO78205.1 hypothetical protein DL763_009742 [Monosporascus cannonballus]RYP28219.1 hypothetical protein DL766_006027 [Monosporascus sp. MC13-8B]